MVLDSTTRERLLETMRRFVRGLRIYEAGSRVQQLAIAKNLLKGDA